MSWKPHDINDPALYMQRPGPIVEKAQMEMHHGAAGEALSDGYQVMPAGDGPPEPDPFVYDDDSHWSQELTDLALEPAAREKRAGQQAQAAPAQQASRVSKTPKAPPEKPGPLRSLKGRAAKRRDGGEPRKGHPYLYVGVITVCTLILGFVVVMMMPQVTGFIWRDLDNFAFVNGSLHRYDAKTVETYRQYREYMRKDVIYPGVFVDGQHVGGMAVEEAKQALSAGPQSTQSIYSVTVAIGNKTWPINGTNVPASKDLGNVAERAYAIGRSNTTEIRGTKVTPFQERVGVALGLRENGVDLKSTAQFDEAALGAVVDEILTFVTRAPQNAVIQSFDYTTRTFTFSDEQVGVTLDRDALYAKIAQSLNKREQGTTITAEPVLEMPEITKAQLMNEFVMIAAYTTDTTSDSNRNNNIQLASQAINGTALLPGETFSFNKATGQRTTDKGYREAGAISAGQTIDEVGGGICQVSSTLFNAVARADLEIVSRTPHAWPSTYVNRGEDATVNWPNLDFQFKNNRDTPVFVITYYKDRKCSAEIWGMSLGNGMTIELKSEIVKTMDPPNEVKYVNNASLPMGTSKETIKPRTGYVVDTYKVWYQNGAEVKREKMHTSTYRAYQRTVEYN